MSGARVSVLVPVHQGAGVFAQAIGNILGQTTPPFEIVVADDGSEDGLAARVEAERPRCAARGVELAHVRFPRRRGRGAARNLALDAARGELVAWFDVDDLWMPEKLARQVAWFAAARADHPANRFILTCDYVRHDAPSWIDPFTVRVPPVMAIDRIAAIHHRRHIQLQTVLGPRDAFLGTGFDDDLNRAEDFDFALRFTAAGGRFVNPDPGGAPLVHYFRGAGNFSAEGAACNRRVVERNAAIFRASHVDPEAFLAHKLGVLGAGEGALAEHVHGLAPGPVFPGTPEPGRPRLTRLDDGAVRIAPPPGATADCVVARADGAVVATRALRGEGVVAQAEIVGWFLAGARTFVLRAASGPRFLPERALIARADSGLISLSRPAGDPPAYQSASE